MNRDLINILLVVSPLIIGFATSRMCDMPNSDHLKIQPPGWVFGVVWTYMYIVMGLLILRCVNFIPYNKIEKVLVLTCLVIHCLLIFMWPYVFSCKKRAKAALFILFGSFITGILLLRNRFFDTSNFLTYLLIPYLCWLLFAILLNVEYVQKDDTV